MQRLFKPGQTANTLGSNDSVESSLKKNTLGCATDPHRSMQFPNVEVRLEADAGEVKMEIPAGAYGLVE